MSRSGGKQLLSEKDWIDVADLATTCAEFLAVRNDEDAPSDGFGLKKADELAAGARDALRVARKLRKKLGGAPAKAPPKFPPKAPPNDPPKAPPNDPPKAPPNDPPKVPPNDPPKTADSSDG